MGWRDEVREQMRALKRNEDRWRGGGQEMTRDGWLVVRMPDCEHAWVYVVGDRHTEGGELARCSRCGSSSITFALGDLRPGESARIGLRLVRDDDE